MHIGAVGLGAQELAHERNAGSRRRRPCSRVDSERQKNWQNGNWPNG
jgi:hypothetical protein